VPSSELRTMTSTISGWQRRVGTLVEFPETSALTLSNRKSERQQLLCSRTCLNHILHIRWHLRSVGVEVVLLVYQRGRQSRYQYQ